MGRAASSDWAGVAGGRYPQLTTARGGSAGSFHDERLMLCWPLVPTHVCFSCLLCCLPSSFIFLKQLQAPPALYQPLLPRCSLHSAPRSAPRCNPPQPPHVYSTFPVRQRCVPAWQATMLHRWEKNSKTLYGVKSCLDGRVGSWYVRGGRFRGKSCRAKPSPDETLSGRHSNSRREKK